MVTANHPPLHKAIYRDTAVTLVLLPSELKSASRALNATAETVRGIPAHGDVEALPCCRVRLVRDDLGEDACKEWPETGLGRRSRLEHFRVA